MPPEALVSYAQNGEDIVLWRALGHVHGGVFVDVGGWDPDVDSVTRLFYERGWRGIDVEPVPELAQRFRERRPHDEVIEAVIAEHAGDRLVLHRFGDTGLSTIVDQVSQRHDEESLSREDIGVRAVRLDDVLSDSDVVAETVHFLKVDVEGAEEQVLRSIDLVQWRPWVLVIEATEPNSPVATHEAWEPLVLAAGYAFTLFDGLSRYYVSADHPELTAALSYPACVLDGFVTAAENGLREESHRLHALAAKQETEIVTSREAVVRWRNDVVSHWAEAMAARQAAEDARRLAESKTKQSAKQLSKVRLQLEQAHRNLQEVRDDRRALRARVSRLAARVERLQQQAVPDSVPSTSQRLRSALKKRAGS